jgi:hypothetical protein
MSSWRTSSVCFASVCAAAVLASTASADLIDFANLPGPNGAAVPNPYIEPAGIGQLNSWTVSTSTNPASGFWTQAINFGTPPPSIQLGADNTTLLGGSINVTLTDGGQFTLASFQYLGCCNNSDTSHYTYAGYLEGNFVFSHSADPIEIGFWTTVFNPDFNLPIDTLVIDFALDLNGPSLSTVNVDNINVTKVTCDGCGGVFCGNCCEPHGTAFCHDFDCCTAVCAIDPTCCETAWDVGCVVVALGLPECDKAECDIENPCLVSDQDCCVGAPSTPPGTPGCSDAVCCLVVCQLDPSCCGSNWDDMCASAAQGLCPNLNCGSTCPADLNGDGVVDGADLGILLGAWGPCPKPPQ